MKCIIQKILPSLIISAVFLIVLFSCITPSDISIVLLSIRPEYILLGFVFYLLFSMFRALRFRSLLDRKIPMKELTPVVFIHGMLNNLMPARTGELSYIYLLKKRGIDSAEGLATLLIARSFDMFSIALLFSVSVFFMDWRSQYLTDLVMYTLTLSSAICLFILVTLLSMVYHRDVVVGFIKRFADRFDLERYSLVSWIIRKTEETSDSFSVIRIKRKQYIVGAYSLMIWLSAYMVYSALLTGMGICLSMNYVIIGATFVIFASFLPLQGLAGFGTVEGAWALAFIALGIPKETAIASGFSFHILRIMYSSILGLISLATMRPLTESRIKNESII